MTNKKVISARRITAITGIYPGEAEGKKLVE